MNLTTGTRRTAPSVRREIATHLYSVGQNVRMKGGFGTPGAADVFHITARLPAKGDELQYRIRNAEERHERVTTQGNLQAIPSTAPGSNDSLIELTFGQRSES